MRHRITHYDTLGIGPDATAEEIRDAFRRLTRAHHPDRFQGEERERAEQRFQAITEAFNVLSRPESREKYDVDVSMRRSGGSPGNTGGMDPREIAKRAAAKGTEHLRAGRLPEALETLKLAIDHDESNARAQHLYGVALSKARGREKDALRHLERAVALEPASAQFKAEAAAVSLVLGMTTRASRLAQEALGLDPTNAKAATVLERVEKAEQSTSEGLLGRLRRKG